MLLTSLRQPRDQQEIKYSLTHWAKGGSQSPCLASKQGSLEVADIPPHHLSIEVYPTPLHVLPFHRRG